MVKTVDQVEVALVVHLQVVQRHNQLNQETQALTDLVIQQVQTLVEVAQVLHLLTVVLMVESEKLTLSLMDQHQFITLVEEAEQVVKVLKVEVVMDQEQVM
jgi:hypothetical protein